MRAHALAAFFLLLSAVPAWAGQQCYTKDEAEAEQLLRLHSELMVITVTCHQGSNGENLVPAYTGFTKMNIKELRAAEETMKAYFHQQSGGDGVAQLDKLRTKLGNEYGKEIARLSAPIFCQMYRDKVLEMCSTNHAVVEEEIHRISLSAKPYTAMCVPAEE